MRTRASRTASRPAEEHTGGAPRADCTADSGGGLTFDVTGPGGAAGDPHLVLRHRDGLREVRLPLAPAAGGRLRAALPGGAELPEGRWDAFLATADGEPERLAPGLNDLRRLVDRAPDPGCGHVAVRIPYATKHGNLSVRSWLRAPHAEAGDLHLGKAGLDVRGRVHGTALTPDAYAELVPRTGAAPLRVGIRRDRADFGLTVDCAALTEGVWDLWLLPAGEGGPRVRVARLLDDIADKKPVLVYPGLTLETPAGPVTATPYYTGGNDLSVSVSVTGPPAP